MDVDFITNQLIALGKAFINSPFFLTLKLILAIYVTVLFADIIMLVFFRGMGDVRATFKGSSFPLLSPKKTRKNWNSITKRLESNDMSQYKLAIIEADAVVGKVLKKLRVQGNDMMEMLKTFNPEQLESEEDLERAHKVRNQIINDPSFHIDKKEAAEIVGIYEKFLVDNEMME